MREEVVPVEKQKYYQPELETMPREEMARLQNERFMKQLHRVYEKVPYYRAKMAEKGVTPDDIKSIEDIRKLPFLSKADLREAYPCGMLAVPLSECVRIQSTSGTTGKRVVAFYTQHDVDLWESCCARAITAAGGTKEDVLQVCYGYGLFTGGMGVHGGSHKVGCLTLPMSSGNTERQIQFMMDLRSTILCCTPSYAAYLGEALKEAGYKPEDNHLKAGIFGAEPWTEEMRLDIQRSLGIKAYDIYGLTETSGPGVAFECCEQHGMHINEDHFYPEIIDPDTGEVLPEGEQGELVFTALDKEAFPLIRYRTRDICVLSREKCSCGRTLIKMSKPRGRTDDMLIIRGVNVFPSQIETVLMEQGYSSNYLITIDRVNNTDTFDIDVEMLPDQFSDTVRAITAKEKALTDALRTMLGITAKVHLVPPKSIQRSEGKAKRLIDKRKLI
ncbi:MAG: phenylacetate--CoA ligase [Oscillospiraceae bacterium]|nr:phenylacetate--CoA ligase [Oscillospiraceae bacterium]